MSSSDVEVPDGLADHVGPILPLYGLLSRTTDVMNDQFLSHSGA